MGDESRRLNPRLTRRQFMQGAVIASSGVLFARLARLARAQSLPVPSGFLSAADLRVVDALTARIIPTDAIAGAHEAGVADYIQGLLSAFLGADVNGDGVVSAADVTAVIQALGSNNVAADVDGSGSVDAADVALTQSSIFGTVLVGQPAFAGRPLFAGGPFSGRTPFPDSATGKPSSTFPPDGFLDPLPLPRVKRLAWTVRLLGASVVPEVADNPLATTLPDVDLRRRYRAGLAQIDALSTTQFGLSFDQLDTTQQDTIIKALKKTAPGTDFYNLAVNHTIEGMLCAPEYGGNRLDQDGQPIGWKITHFDGDSQPLGYTIFDTTTMAYVERPDKPNSTIDPDDDCSGFSDEMIKFLDFVLVQLAGATHFTDPSCNPD
jgi:gluconate 2-dehydrogenase subunit 3-like protein/dockerin type I repeat protein